MLHEIYCEQFHQKRIVFNPGLSVVLGTNAGDNSIGKSTFLLIVDYVFGGSTYDELVSDIRVRRYAAFSLSVSNRWPLRMYL